MSQNDIWKLVHVQDVNGQRLTNVFFYEQQDPDGPSDPKVDLATAFETVVATQYEDNLAAGWDGLCYEVSNANLTGQQFFRQLSTKGPGTVLGDTINAATVATIATFTPGGSHTGTGRSFISGFPDSYENRNNLNTAGLTAIDLIGDTLIPLISNGGVSFQCGRFNKLAAPPFEAWILSDVRVPLTKLRPRRQSTRC